MLGELLFKRVGRLVESTGEDERALRDVPVKVKELPSGAEIGSAGDPATRLHIILEGWAARYESLDNGSRQITAFLLPGDFCDLHAAYLPNLHHSVCTLTPVKIAEFPRDQLIEVQGDRTNVSRAIWLHALKEERVLRAWLVNIAQREASPRIANLICELHARSLELGLARDLDFDLPLTQAELGEALGLTAVHVSRTLKRLREDGLIDFRRGSFNILDIDALKSLADFDPYYLRLEQAA